MEVGRESFFSSMQLLRSFQGPVGQEVGGHRSGERLQE